MEDLCAADSQRGHTATHTHPLPKALPAQEGERAPCLGLDVILASKPHEVGNLLNRASAAQTRRAQHSAQHSGHSRRLHQPRLRCSLELPGGTQRLAAPPKGQVQAAERPEGRRGVGNYVTPSSRHLAALSILRSTALPSRLLELVTNACA